MPRYAEYGSNAERRKAYRERKKAEAAAHHLEYVALRRVAGADDDEVIDDAIDALTGADRAGDHAETAAWQAAFAAGRQEGYDEGYAAGYAAAASARLEELLTAKKASALEVAAQGTDA